MNRFIITMFQILIFWGMSANAVSNNCYVTSTSGQKKPAVRCVRLVDRHVVTMCDGRLCTANHDAVKKAKFTCPRSKKNRQYEGVYDREHKKIALFAGVEKTVDLIVDAKQPEKLVLQGDGVTGYVDAKTSMLHLEKDGVIQKFGVLSSQDQSLVDCFSGGNGK